MMNERNAMISQGKAAHFLLRDCKACIRCWGGPATKAGGQGASRRTSGQITAPPLRNSVSCPPIARRTQPHKLLAIINPNRVREAPRLHRYSKARVMVDTVKLGQDVSFGRHRIGCVEPLRGNRWYAVALSGLRVEVSGLAFCFSARNLYFGARWLCAKANCEQQ